MNHFKQFKLMTSGFTEEQENIKKSIGGALFLISEEGVDWYQSQKSFSKETLKIAYGDDGVIRSVSGDVSTLWPNGLSVVEINSEDVPQQFLIDGTWLFVDGRIIRNDPLIKMRLELRNKAKQRSLLENAMLAVFNIKVALQLEKTVIDVETMIADIYSYCDVLRNIDTTDEDANFPAEPAIVRQYLN